MWMKKQTFVLSTVSDSVKTGRKDKLSSCERLQETVGGMLAEICSTAQDHTPTAPDYGYSFLKHLAAYPASSFKKQSAQRHFSLWSCHHGSFSASFEALKTRFQMSYKETGSVPTLFGPFWPHLRTVMWQASAAPFHKNTATTAELLCSYITLRMHFAVKDVCKNLCSLEKVAFATNNAKPLRRLPVQLLHRKQHCDCK